jgi:hypothetical protein
MPRNSRFFSDLDWLLQFNKVVLKTVHQQADFKFIDVEEKLAPFRFQHHCVQFGFIQRVRVAKYYESMKSAQRTKPQHRCFNHATIQHPVLVQPRNLALPESDSQNLEFIADSEALLKFQTKNYQITLLKITSRNCVALSIILSIINQKQNHHVKQKTIKKSIYGNTRL